MTTHVPAPTVGEPPKRHATGRPLRLEQILTLLVADGLVTNADADALSRSKTRRVGHPLEIVAAQNWRAASGSQRPLTLEWLVEWLAGKLGIPYMHIDPLKIDLNAVTQTMT